MGPIPGVSWADVFDVGQAVLVIAGLIWIVSALADTPRRDDDRRSADRVAFATMLAFLFVLANRRWLPAPDAFAVLTLVAWIAAVVIASRRPALFRFGRGKRDLPTDVAEPTPAGTPDLQVGPVPLGAKTADPGGGPVPDPDIADASTMSSATRPRRRRWRSSLALAAILVAPRAAADVLTQSPCEQAEVVLAGQEAAERDAPPQFWMPRINIPGYGLTESRSTSLQDVVASRRNPGESRTELVRDAFVGGYEERWDGAVDHLEFGAQRFATPRGALAFQAFATRYACQFANTTFRGSNGGVGLQIRFASGKPIGEQLSWVSGSTRILVFVDFATAPPDHAMVESLVRFIGP